MSKIVKERVTAQIQGDFVVFVIGMRVNNPLMIHKWIPVVRAMPKMLKELYAKPESGFLGSMGAFPFMVQYWRSFEHLSAYSRDRDQSHFPAWVNFNQKIATRGQVGIFHETYLVKAGEYETIYHAIPPTGLGKFVPRMPAVGKYGSSRSRVGKTPTDDTPITLSGDVIGDR